MKPPLSFMLSQGVILFRTLWVKERKQLSKYRSQILKSLKSSVSYHFLKIRSLKNSVVSWSDLWLSCTAVRVPTRQSTKLDKFYLRKVIKALRIFLQLKPLLHSTSKEAKRAAYQAGHVWGQALEPMQELLSPAERGWQQSPEGWSPKWTMLAEASKACSELISCGCKRACRGLCKCTKATCLALHYVLVQEFVTKNRVTFKSVSFMTHSIKKLS